MPILGAHYIDQTNGNKRLVCWLRYEAKADPIQGRWRYGTTPSGYQLKVCEPLTPGKTYHLGVSVPGGLVSTDFLIDDKGNPSAISDLCS